MAFFCKVGLDTHVIRGSSTIVLTDLRPSGRRKTAFNLIYPAPVPNAAVITTVAKRFRPTSQRNLQFHF